MKMVGLLVGLCGVASLIMGIFIAASYMELVQQAKAAESARGLASIGAAFQLLGQFIKWAKDAFVLLIINLFVTGFALVLTSVALAKAASPK